MKKICKLFGVLLAFTMVIGLASCDGLFNPGNTGFGRAGNAGNSGSQQQGDTDPIKHTFIKDDTTGISFFYYTSTTRFTYPDNPEICYYQISFNAGEKTWILYARPAASTKAKEQIANGTYTGDPSKVGTLVLTSPDGKAASQTIEIKTNDAGRLYFVGDVTASHKYLNAQDEK